MTLINPIALVYTFLKYIYIYIYICYGLVIHFDEQDSLYFTETREGPFKARTNPGRGLRGLGPPPGPKKKKI